jgi:hypothetical protein
MVTKSLKTPISWLVSRRADIAILVGLTILGMGLRSTGIFHGVGFHPDERHMAQVTEKLGVQHMNPKSFAYGSFSFYAAWGFAHVIAFCSGLIEWATKAISPNNAVSFGVCQRFSYDCVFISGRIFCTVVGGAAIPLAWYLAVLLYRRSSVGLVAAALLSLNVFHLQLSRFFTSDITLTTLCLISLIALVKAYEQGTLRSYLIFGFCAGLATATKISSAFLFVPLFFVVFLSTIKEWGRLTTSTKPLACLGLVAGALALTALADFLLFFKGWPRVYGQRLQPLPTLIPLSIPFIAGAAVLMRRYSRPLSQLTAAVALGIAVFVMAEPYAIIDFETFSKHTREQTAMVQGQWRPPYTIQYAHTVPYFYHLKQMLWYTMGWPVFLAGLLGVTLASLRCVLEFFDKLFKRELRTSPFSPEIIPLIFMAVFFIATARFQVKFPRYLLPLYPLIFIFAASIIAPRGKRVRVADGPGDEEPQEAPVQMVASASVAPEAVATEPLQQEVVSVETTPAETAHGEPAERTNS